jgi:hypothetical protein
MAVEMALPELFRGFAESAQRDGARTYAAICRSVADDSELLALMARAPLTQRRPNLLLAAVHFLLLGGTAHPLAAHYDSVTAFRGADPVAPPGDVGTAFKDFCLVHRDRLLELIATGSTQTNEIGRCSALLPALSLIGAAYGGDEPLGLLDLGTSAGLNLYFDRYAYAYRHQGDGAVVTAGDESSDVMLECTVRGELTELPSLVVPALAERAGLDRAPIDPRDEAGALWLLACLWPDNLPRFARLRSALEIARGDPRPPVLHTGDMIDQLPGVAASVAPGQPLVVFHSWVAAYLTEARQRQLVETVGALSTTRPVHHLYAESPVETPGLAIPPPPRDHSRANEVTALVHTPPGGRAVRLADMHHHGRSLRWWPTRPGPTGRRAGPAPAPRRR